MALETGTYISDLVITNPVIGDDVGQGDDHLRLVKATVKTTFPNITGAVTPTHTQLNYVAGVTSALQTQLDAKAAITYVDAGTSNIQTQLNAKAALASPALTGTPTVPTATAGTNTTQIASTAFVRAEVAATTVTGTWTLITSTAAVAATNVDFTGLSATYDEYMVTLLGVSGSANTTLQLRTSTNNGSSYDAAAGNYKWSYGGGNTSGVFTGSGSGSATQIEISQDIVAVTTDPVQGVVLLFKPIAATKTLVTWTIPSTDGSASRTGAGARQANTGAVNAIRFLAGSVTLTGTFNLLARRK